jgi:hypothetical protein
MPDEQPQALSRLAAARFLGGISTRMVDKLRRRGLLPARSIGRRVFFLREDLERFLAAARHAA